MTIRKGTIEDKDHVLSILDEFRADCLEQMTGETSKSNSAVTHGVEIYESLLDREDYYILLLVNNQKNIVGIITGYLCPMLRNGKFRAEIEEFYIKPGERGNNGAKDLMDAFINWAKEHNAQKINLESDNKLKRAHSFYKKYGFENTATRFVKKI